MRPGTGSGAARASAVSFCLLIAAVVAGCASGDDGSATANSSSSAPATESEPRYDLQNPPPHALTMRCVEYLGRDDDLREATVSAIIKSGLVDDDAPNTPAAMVVALQDCADDPDATVLSVLVRRPMSSLPTPDRTSTTTPPPTSDPGEELAPR
ncbi:hypothetical protein [Gordonia iterans]